MTKVLSHKKQIISMLGSLKGTRILDYGCGQGDFIGLILNSDNLPSKIMAVDSDQETIDYLNSTITHDILGTRVVSNPQELTGNKFDKIICHNVLECVDNKLEFINIFQNLLSDSGQFLLSHHDFDSAIFNSNYKPLTRELIHHFADTQQTWQKHSDGQMGRKIPGLINRSVFKNNALCQTIRVVETDFKAGKYGYLMANMISEIAESTFDTEQLLEWKKDLERLDNGGEYYFAIDIVVAVSKPLKR